MDTMDRDDVMEVDEELDMESNGASGSDAPPDTLRILEALLFASDELLSAVRIKAILPGNPDARQIRKLVDKINIQLQKERHPFEIVEIGGGYQFRTVAYFHPWVRQIFKEKAAKKLSLQALECLAVIAYKQPVSKAEIEAVRGVVSDGAMKTLLEKKLVTISGRSEKPGRPLQYSTTHEFLRYFGLNKIEDLPRIEEFEAIAREKIEDLSFEELTNGAIEGDEALPVTDDQEIQNVVTDKPEPVLEAPEPTAVFEIDASDILPESETIISEESQQSTGQDEQIEVFEGNELATNLQDIDESETTEISVEQREIIKRETVVDEIVFDSPKISDDQAIETKSVVKEDNEQKTKESEAVTDSSQELDEEELLEVFIPEKIVTENDEGIQEEKKGFFSKIRKKKKEESDQ